MSAEHPNRCCPTDKGVAKCAYHPNGDGFYMVGPYDSKAGVVLVSDIFGMEENSKRLADMLAQQGYLVLMPDFFERQPWPASEWPADFESERWTAHMKRISDLDFFAPRMEKAIAVLRGMGCLKVGAIGMCWGSALSFMMAAQSKVDAAATAHPARLTAANVKAAMTPVLVMPSKDEPPMEEIEAAVNAHPIEPRVYKRFEALPHGFFGARYDPDSYTGEEVKEEEEARELLFKFFEMTLR
ncbi:hypothetical protein LSCM1_00698 [Leishmania martiniquensis]|uniref:Dienelactone hydrolase domain-containing protein n=1 Tax=Leishmania martiniquensis TaxID=1580590 RepID=A0A836GIL2_9TRYP|nr:hypothetical protein LSCM1_00698 [Leishmania martiniquensis]